MSKSFAANGKRLIIFIYSFAVSLISSLIYIIDEDLLKFLFSGRSATYDVQMVLDKAIPANGNADLIVFNGHNGLLDYEIVLKNRKCVNQKETAIICCGSYYNFIEKIKLYHTFRLLTTLDAIPAEAYILASIIEPWAMLKSDEEIRQNVMRKYISIHHCSNEDADRIFVTGFLY